jgi:nucleotide-binding universal stress UspA family protein
VLLVTDGSDCSRQAAEYMGSFPWPENVQVRVMHVLPPQPGEVMPSWPPGAEILTPIPPVREHERYDWQEEEECRGREILEQALKTLQASGIEARSILMRGDAATEIIEYVKEHQIDLVLAGSRGLSVVQSWLLGSLSRKLIHYSGRSVLIVKGRLCQPAEV